MGETRVPAEQFPCDLSADRVNIECPRYDLHVHWILRKRVIRR